MKIVIVNGSARKGNTYTAIEAFMEGAKEQHEIDVIHADKLDMAPCKGCGSCGCYKGCIDKDETNPTVDKLVAADMIVFATPVYWWGMTAQIKLVIDKCYCRGAQLKGKKVGVLVVGGAAIDALQYELIGKQFECMANYLSWDLQFCKSYSATKTDDLKKDEAAIAEIKGLVK